MHIVCVQKYEEDVSYYLLELAKFHTIVTDNSLKYDVKIIVRSTILLSKKVVLYYNRRL